MIKAANDTKKARANASGWALGIGHGPGRTCRVALGCCAFLAVGFPVGSAGLPVLKPAAFARYVQSFNTMEDENVTNYISNAASWDWLQKEIPFFECPDREVEEM